MMNLRSFQIVLVVSSGSIVACIAGMACSSPTEVLVVERSIVSAYAHQGVPVGFDRRGGYVVFDDQRRPSFEAVKTAYPVLHFTGANADGSAMAYTSLAKIASAQPTEMVSIDLEEGVRMSISDLIPTGQLVIEHREDPVLIQRPNAFITSAAWHPRDPDLIAYAYSQVGDAGIVVLNRQTGEERDLFRGALAPDYIAWSDDGAAVGAYIEDTTAPVQEFGHGIAMHPKRWGFVSLTTGNFLNPERETGGDRASLVLDPAKEIHFLTAGHARLADPFGDGEARFRTAAGDSVFRADQVRFRSPEALVFVNFDGDRMALWATNGALPPQEIVQAMSVAYYIPMDIGETPIAFTQVGSGYNPGCAVWNHAGAMKYAIDMQIVTSDPNKDQIIVSAAGSITTFAGGWACNKADQPSGPSYDGSTCFSYQNPCNANGGWGNYIIIGHADGKYSFYGHLEPSNFKPTKCGPVAKGCWLGDEGATGASSGKKNGCGDHLHFQWQSGNFSGSSSIAGAFQDAAALGAGSCTSQNPLTVAMSCAL